MTPPKRRAADLSDDELRTLASHIARICLEVERGLRSPDHLRALADPATSARWRAGVKIGRFRGGPPVRQDVGPPQLSRLSDDHAIATVVTRTEGARWGAVTLQLRAAGTKWHVADLQRLLAAAHYRGPRSRDVDDPISLDDRIDRSAEEQRLGRAALAAARRRLDDLGDAAPGRDAVERQVAHLKRALAHLERELSDLRSRRDLRRAVAQIARK